jgi:hypothetical protein
MVGGDNGLRRRSFAASFPHLRPADKGFDALLVPLDARGAALSGIIICEEKATGSPRKQITSEVWRSIASVEAGDRDAELTGELTAILERYRVQNIEQVVADAHWLNRKAYRVSVTITASDEPDAVRRKLFEGFDSLAHGDLWRRRAETLTLLDLRGWMDDFSAKVCHHLKKLDDV